MNKNFFYNKSKADVINSLSKIKGHYNIPKTYSFKVREWDNNKNKIYKIIKKKFKNCRVAIRSSSKSEDKVYESQAGKYESILNVGIFDKKKFFKNVSRVIKSYRPKNSLNQVIIQKMITNVSMSGVIFTKDIENGNNYYVVNYDDVTGKTNTVTSGQGIFSNRILYIFKQKKNQVRSPRFKKLVKGVSDLEKKLKSDNLDIEFAITRKLKLYIFQVRLITTTKKWKTLNFTKHSKILSNEALKLRKLLKKKSGVNGNSTILGQMPDWNPVEILGKHPSELSSSIYKELITNKVWAEARFIMGYKDMTKHKLMHSIIGQQYIDTRLSLNSFLPFETPTRVSDIIVNQGIEKLKQNPYFHDKIEFEISTPSFTFDLRDKLNKRFKKKLSISEKKTFETLLKKQTLLFLKNQNNFSIKKISKKIELLDKKFSTFNKKNINQLPEIINICKRLGTLNFSILARHGFVAKAFLNSMISKGIISNKNLADFEQNLNTITNIMINDINNLNQKKISKKKFNEKYGHLRPGTYDITSKRYDQVKDLKFKITKKRKIRNIYSVFINQKGKIENILRLNNLNGIDYYKFIDYLSSAISYREYSKFIFTKYISLILELIYEFGKKYKFSRNDLSNLNIKFFLNEKYLKKKKFLSKKINQNSLNHEIYKNIKLPMLILDQTNLVVVPYQVNLPNFITKRKVSGEFIVNPNIKDFRSIRGKIILIENADPGYDWIFGNNIRGLVTKYGGINSHMAIRCSEQSIPAVIGCGEQIFNKIINNKEIFIDCSSSLIYSR